MAASRRQSLEAAKAARQKKIAVVGGVVLLAVLAIQVPRTLDMLGSAEPAPAVGEPLAVSTGEEPAVDPSTGAPVTASAVLVDSDPLPTRSTEHVISFERFASKDPFVQQVSSEPTALTPSPATRAVPVVPPAVAPPATTTVAPAAPAQSEPAGRAVTVEVNGKRETVAVSATFPAADPTFRLVSVTGTTAMIGLAGGTYANGVETVALQLGKSLTLANTADGTRYELRLVSVG